MIENEQIIRLTCFLVILLIVLIWEVILPKRKLKFSKLGRWFVNLIIIAINGLIVRLLLPILPVTVALYCNDNSIGVFNLYNVGYIYKVVISFILLDLIIYLQHLMFHAVPFFWKFHMMHHADRDIDLTTGLRFHPVEIVLSSVIKIASIYLLGVPVVSVIIFEVVLNGAAMFNHANISIPNVVDKYLRFILVTPDMHRVHHSVVIRETNSNFGFNLPWWDRLLGTYREQPSQGHLDMTIGLSHFQDKKPAGLIKTLLMPFINKTGPYPINKIGREPSE